MVEVKKTYGEAIIDDAIAEGFAKGFAEGFAEGFAKGSMQKALQIAKKLLHKETVEYLSDLLELPIEYIQAVKDGESIDSIIERFFHYDYDTNDIVN